MPNEDPLPSADTAPPRPAEPAPTMDTGAEPAPVAVARAEGRTEDEPGARAPEATPLPAGETAAAVAPSAPDLSPAACGARLAELFPALFAAPGAPGPAKPIKLRIHADIQARAPGVFTKRVLGIFFSRYTTTNAYLKALTLAPHRFDLDGQPAGEISDDHRRLAAEELARRHALAAERRAALRPPRHEVPQGAGVAPEARPERRPAPRPDNRPAASPSSLSARPPRPPRHVDRPPRAEQPPRPQRRDPAQAQRAEAPAAMPADPVQRERAMLLRSFESSPLSKANFCALKGITETALDAALALAQAERGERRTPWPLNAAAPPGSGRR